MALPKIEVEVTADTARAEKGLDRVERGMRDVGSAADRASTRTDNLGGTLGRTSARSTAFRSNIQNVSFQLQDFATQVGSGTSASVALGQQLPQLLSGFGAVGAAIGAVAAIAIPALSYALAQAQVSVKSFDDTLDELNNIMEGAKESTEILSLSIDELIKQYGEAARQTREFALAQAELRQAQAADRLAEQLGMVNSELSEFISNSKAVGGPAAAAAFFEYQEALNNIIDTFSVTRDQAILLETQLQNLSEAGDFETQKAALETVLSTLEDMQVPLSALPPELRLAVDEMITLIRETEAAKVAMDNLAAAARNVSTGVPLFLQGFSDQDLLPPELTGEGDEEGGGTGGRRRSGGGSSIARGNPALERLVETLKTQREIVEQWRQEGLDLLNQANEQELAIIGGYNEAKLRLEAEYQRRLARLKASGNKNMISETLSAGKTILQAVGQTNEKAFKIAQAFGAAEVLVNAFVGASKELKEKGVIGIATAASVIAAGVGFVTSLRSIRPSTSSGGVSGGFAGGFGGGGGAAAAPAPAPAPEVSRNVAIKLEGGVFGRDQVINLINEINEAVEDGAVVRLA